MEIREVSFRGSALKPSDRPQEFFPQIAVAGRSNVGKSSLLNWLLRQNLARVAKAPGKTRMLNFFLINRSFFLVDLPGYGYAKVGRALQEEWGRELGNYLATEERLAGVITLVDIRHGPTDLDLGLQEMLLAQREENASWCSPRPTRSIVGSERVCSFRCKKSSVWRVRPRW